MKLFFFCLLFINLIFASCGKDAVKPVKCKIDGTVYDSINTSAKIFKNKVVICLQMPDRKKISFLLQTPPNFPTNTTYNFTHESPNIVFYHSDSLQLPYCNLYEQSEGGKLVIEKIDENLNTLTGKFSFCISNEKETIKIKGSFDELPYNPIFEDDSENAFFAYSRLINQQHFQNLLLRENIARNAKTITVSTAFAYASSLLEYDIYFSDKITVGTHEMNDFKLRAIYGREESNLTSAPAKLVIIKHDTTQKEIVGAFYGKIGADQLDQAVFYGHY